MLGDVPGRLRVAHLNEVELVPGRTWLGLGVGLGSGLGLGVRVSGRVYAMPHLVRGRARVRHRRPHRIVEGLALLQLEQQRCRWHVERRVPG